jgi:hypothetical protein
MSDVAIVPLAPTEPPLSVTLLLDIARGLAAAEDLWRPHARHDLRERRPVRLVAADRWEAWVIGWTPGQGVELHDHGPSAGALAVVEGVLAELTDHGGRLVQRHLPAGTAVELPAGVVHDVVATGAAATTSIHVYSPALAEMTFYDDAGQPARTLPVPDEAPVTDLRRVARALHPSTRRG